MKKYEILYAQDVPHYGTVELEAENDAAIVEAAKAYWNATDLDPVDDPDWNNPVCKRIVVIRDEAGNEIANDVRCDDYNLEYITDEDRTMGIAYPLLPSFRGCCFSLAHFARPAADINGRPAPSIRVTR